MYLHFKSSYSIQCKCISLPISISSFLFIFQRKNLFLFLRLLRTVMWTAQVEYAVTHPQYDVDTVDNDVALLRLPAGWSTDPPGVACLPRPRQPLPARRLCTILGWGKRRSSDMFGTDVLQEAQVRTNALQVWNGQGISLEWLVNNLWLYLKISKLYHDRLQCDK